MALPRLFSIAFFVLGVACTPAAIEPVSADDHVSVGPVLATINKFRSANGLSTLTIDKRLMQAADRHARSMAKDDFFSHVGANGSRIGQRVSDAGYPWRLVAENIAAGMADGIEAVGVWIDSPGHRKNMLTDGHKHAGIGYARISPDPGKVVYKQYWVLVLGAPLKNW
tara:strand:- start:5242 stop:5745 length:504 start_codon:yes stop_codon:yes gene_type:complete